MKKGNFERIVRGLDNGGRVVEGAGHLLDTRYYFGEDMLAAAQGITNDGRYLYCAGTVKAFKYNGFSKIDLATGEVVLRRGKYMPPALAELGCDHYGGCTYFENKIYVAIEDAKRRNPCIGVFSADDFEFTGQFKTLAGNIQPNGNLPWCAADKENRILYTGYFHDCDHINVFSIDDLTFLNEIPISRVVQHTQGAEMHGGLIYISCHDSAKKKHIYSIDPGTGEVKLVMERDAGRIVTESEGVTVVGTEDGAFFYQLDVLYPFGLAIRKYALS